MKRIFESKVTTKTSYVEDVTRSVENVFASVLSASKLTETYSYQQYLQHSSSSLAKQDHPNNSDRFCLLFNFEITQPTSSVITSMIEYYEKKAIMVPNDMTGSSVPYSTYVSSTISFVIESESVFAYLDHVKVVES